MKPFLLTLALCIASFAQSAPVAAAPAQRGIVLSWGASDAGSTYNVYRATTAGAENYATPYATGLMSPLFVDLSGTPGTTYYYTFIAVLVGNASSATTEVSAVFPSASGVGGSTPATPATPTAAAQ